MLLNFGTYKGNKTFTMGILASFTLKQENLRIKWKWNVNDFLIGREWQIDFTQIIENQGMKTKWGKQWS